MESKLLDVSAYLLLILPVLLILLILLVEGLILHFFKIGKLLQSIGYAFVANGTSVLICFFAAGLLKFIGYRVSLTFIPLQVLLFFCWLSIIIEGNVLKLLQSKIDTVRLFSASIFINLVSFLFIYLFLLFSH